eukprot:scaffold49191_cov23-Cyclotella_meneghiniana.AAC.1
MATNHPRVIELAVIRTNTLKTKTLRPFSWKMSNAVFPGSHATQVTPFLRSSKQSETFHDFNGIGHARNWASKYFGGISRGGYSAVAQPSGRGGSAFVVVTKTRAYHDAVVALYNKQQNELKELKATFGDRLNDGVSVQVDSDKGVTQENPSGEKNAKTPKSWKQPNAVFSGSNADEVNNFLRGEEQSRTFDHFQDLEQAEKWADEYFNGDGKGRGYSAVAAAGRDSSGAFVTVTKSTTDSSDDRPHKRHRTGD